MPGGNQPCPHCGRPIALEAGSCPHCNRRALFDLLTMFETPDARVAYHAARGLLEVHGQPHEFLVLKRRLLEAPGLLVTSVPKSIADACQEKLAAHGLATQVSHQIAKPVEIEEAQQPETKPAGRAALQFIRDRPGTAAALLVGIALIVAVFVLGPTGSRSSLNARVGPIGAEQFAKLVQGGVVEISCEERSGSGFFVTEGILVTAAGAVCPAVPSVDVEFSDGSTVLGRVIRIDNWLGFAVVRTSGSGGHPLQLADSSSLLQGDSVVRADLSDGTGASLSRTKITDPNRNLLGTSVLLVDAASTRPESGEPLFDDSGRVLGVLLTRMGSTGNLWFALPSNYLVEGTDAFFSDLEMELDRNRWEARVREARDADRATVAKARTSPGQAGLVAARISSPDSVAATVARWSATTPTDQQFSFTIRRGESVLCSVSGAANRWQRAAGGSLSIPTSRYVMWLERNNLLEDTYVSLVRLDTSACSDSSAIPGATVVLHNGVPYADRSTVGSN